MPLQAKPVRNAAIEAVRTLTSYVCASVSFPRARLISAMAFTPMIPFSARFAMLSFPSLSAEILQQVCQECPTVRFERRTGSSVLMCSVQGSLPIASEGRTAKAMAHKLTGETTRSFTYVLGEE